MGEGVRPGTKIIWCFSDRWHSEGHCMKSADGVREGTHCSHIDMSTPLLFTLYHNEINTDCEDDSQSQDAWQERVDTKHTGEN